MQVFISISLILGDGMYNLIKIILITVREMYRASSQKNNLPVVSENPGEFNESSLRIILTYEVLSSL